MMESVPEKQRAVEASQTTILMLDSESKHNNPSAETQESLCLRWVNGLA